MLQRLALFESLTDQEVNTLLSQAVVREYTAGTVIFSEGSLSDTFSVVLEGEIEILKSLSSEDERLIKILGPDDFLGELSLVHLNHHRSAAARARTQVRLLDIPTVIFETLVKENGRLAFALMQTMSQRMIETENATIDDLKARNRQLAASLNDLKQAQAQLLEKEKIETELNLARQIQQTMLPHQVPALPGWQLQAYWQPARSVSGDFYDFIPLADGRVAVIIGDVTGKGVPAALLMAVTRTVLRAAADQCPAPGELLVAANELLCAEIPPNMFVTCHVSYLDPAAGRITFANAGHCLPICHHNGQIRELRAVGMPLGLMAGMTYGEDSIQLLPGDRLLYYSDGLAEARDTQGVMVGVPRVREMLSAACQGQPQPSNRWSEDFNRVIDFVLDQLQRHTGPMDEPDDDITLVSLEYTARQA